MYSYYGQSPLELLILAWTPWVPVFGVWIGGIVVALAMMPLAQRASGFTIAGIALLATEAFFGAVATWLLTKMLSTGAFGLGGNTEVYTLGYGALALGRASVRALGLTLLFAAVLQGRLRWPEATS